MRNIVRKSVILFFVLSIMLVGCSKKNINKEEAYNIYYDTIKKFVPELMTDPQESDISIKTRDEVTFANETFVRNTNVEIKSQNVDGELQYYLLNKFPEADKLNFYYISGNKFYTASSKMNEKGNLKEWNPSYIDSFLFTYLNTPFFKQEAIKSFDVKNKISETEITFIVDGSNMEYGYPQRVMNEIFPTLDDKLDDVKIILTIDNDGIPKTMSTEISMSTFNVSGNLHAKKTLNMDFVFNNFNNVEFDLDTVISQYTLDASN